MALIQLTTEMTEQEERAAQNSNNLYRESELDALKDLMAPIGYSFDWSPVEGKPTDLSTAQKVHDHYGFGTWALLGVGRTTVCIDTSDPNFDTAGKTYGEKTHTLTTSEMPSHSHPISPSVAGYYPNNDAAAGSGIPRASGTEIAATGSAGSGGAHNNIQPSIAVYRWQRIA